MAAISKQDFVVRQAKSLNDLRLVDSMCLKEGWPIREKESCCYYVAGMLPHFFLGELCGEVIGCISLFKHDPNYCCVGVYVVDAKHRGRGYGLQMWKRAMEYAGENSNVVLCAVPNMAETYKKSGLKCCWKLLKYKMAASSIEKALADQVTPEGVTILSSCEADFDKLDKYDARILGVSRRNLLAFWIALDACISLVAHNSRGDIVGHVVMTRDIQGMHFVMPLISDNEFIARSLLKSAVMKLDCSMNPQLTVVTYAPEHNKQASEMYEQEFEGCMALALDFMTTKDFPGNTSAIFSLPSTD